MALALAACLHGVGDASCGAFATQRLAPQLHGGEPEQKTVWATHMVELINNSASSGSMGLGPELLSRSESIVSRKTSTVCIHDRAVPTFYLLGQQKAGTSTLSTDLFYAGVRSGNAFDKELHTFDEPCNFQKAIDRTPEEWAGHSGTCKPLNPLEALEWSRNNFDKDCTWSKGELADMTPENLRLPGLPPVLRQLYAGQGEQLKFVIALRDPLARLHSGYYQYQIPGFESFAGYVDMLLKRLPMYRSNGWSELETDYLLDQFYRSMYSLNVGPWLEAFHARQFVVVPMTQYFESLERRRAILDELASKFEIELHSENVRSTSQVYSKEHASLEEDLSEETIAALRSDYFDPDAERLARLLAPKLSEGLTVSGFPSSLIEPVSSQFVDTVLKFIVDNW